ncbi:glycosyltransferase family 9 protein [Butyricimonas sp.]|uniref:glycosyltransferase family 9 protein n=1 Tax=Butyricimonas sp. TaxID=1969738 RepID=UPI0025BD598F|nr:glycosyltransferase family 9 protein [Butyricimonas sp.]
MKRIIIRMPNFIGDSINTIPAIEMVVQSFPQARITLLGPSFLQKLFENDPRIDSFIVSDKRKKHYFKNVLVIYKNKYDLGILFTNTFVSALIFKLAFVKQIVGYQSEGRGMLLNFRCPLNRNVHYINRYAMLVNSFLNNKFTYLPPLKLYYKQERNFNFDNDKAVVGLYLGGTNKRYRRYPEDHSLALLYLLKDYNMILIGDSNDAIVQSSYAHHANMDNLLDFSGKTSVGELITTIANLDLLITIDSAAMHIASAVGTKFIALMGLSTSPTSTVVPKTNLGVILKIENNMIDEACYIQNITPEIVYQNVRLILDKQKD